MARDLSPIRRHHFYDTEFIDHGARLPLDLISLGIVSETGAEYYAVSSEFDQDAALASDFHVAYVLPHLPSITVNGKWTLDLRSELVKSRAQIATEVWDFLTNYQTESPRLWAWYDAHDFLALTQLWGPLHALPDLLPMNGLDLKQEYDRQGMAEKPPTDASEHNALADARWNRELAYWLGIIER